LSCQPEKHSVSITPRSKTHEGVSMRSKIQRQAAQSLALTVACLMPVLALAQAAPFDTGLTNLQNNIIVWLTPVAIILVIVLGGMAMAGRLAWGWVISVLIGIVIAFGAQRIVEWIKGLFGVG